MDREVVLHLQNILLAFILFALAGIVVKLDRIATDTTTLATIAQLQRHGR